MFTAKCYNNTNVPLTVGNRIERPRQAESNEPGRKLEEEVPKTFAVISCVQNGQLKKSATWR